MKKILKEAKHKAKTWEENRHRLKEVVTLSCTKFTDEGITNEMFAKAKVF